MRRRAVRALSAGTVGLAALAGSILWAVPAEACSCGGGGGIPKTLPPDSAIAIVTRTDAGPAVRAGSDVPIATFRVEDSIGSDVPEPLTGQMDTGASCQPYVAPGAIAALGFQKKNGAWHLGSCSSVDLGEALQRAQGDPVAAEGGPAVAYLAGAYGVGRVAAVDQAGRVVAWDKTTGYGDLVAACPDAKIVVVVGRTPAKDYEKRIPELTIHDAATLKVLRTVKLGTAPEQQPVALRCADPRGERVDLFVRDGSDENSPADVLTVRGSKVSGTDVGPGSDATATDKGFVVLVSERSKQVSVALVTPDGKRSTIAELPELEGSDRFAVSGDEGTVAVIGARSEPRVDALVTIDVESGKRLGEWTRKELSASGLAWTASDTLLLRDQNAYMPRSVPVRAFDRTLTERDTWPDVADEWGGRFTAVGDAAVVYGDGSLLTATPENGTPLVADSLRLAAATHLVALPGAEFAAGEATPEPSAAPSDEVTVADEPSSIDTGLLTGLGAVAAVGGIAAAVVAGRLRNH